MRFKLFSITCLGFLALLTACLPVTTRSSGRPGDDGSLSSQAEAAYAKGQYDLAADYYRQALAGGESTESLLAGYGLAAEKAGRFPEAAQAYERLISRFPAGEFAGESRFRLLSVHLANGDGAAAERLAVQLLEGSGGRRAEITLALGRARWLTGKYREAAETFLEAFRGGSGPVRQEARRGVLGSLARLDYQSLAAIQQNSGLDFPGPEATYLLLYQSASAGNREHAEALAEYFRRYFGESSLLPQVQATAQAVSSNSALPPPAFGADYDPRAEVAAALAAVSLAAPADLRLNLPPGGVTLAVILPLGDKKGAGQFAREVVRGLELAVKELAPGRVGLTVLDTGGGPDQAARRLAQAAADPRVLAVVGPMLREESIAAAEAAGSAGLPLIIISQAPDLPRNNPNVFRLFLTPRHQAETLARYAVRAQNHQALGIIYPDDNFGRTVLAAFQAEAARLGAKVTVTDRYSPRNPDMEAVAGRVTGGSQGARRVSTDYQAKMDCTALFLPDSPGPVAQLLPLLAFHDVTRMPYLGSSLWLDAPDFLASSARYLQGAVIPAPLSDLSQRPESRHFFETFQKAYGYAPHQFAAYGYDAGLALIRALGQGADSREALRLALARGGITPGATGPFSFGRDGEYQAEPALLTIREREFVLLREPERPAGN